MGIATVIGIGNLLMADDGVGVHAIQALRERYGSPAGLTFIDGGTMGLDLLPYIEEAARLMLIDAVDFGEPAGTVKVIEGPDVKMFLDLKFSVHQIGIPDMLFAASFKGVLPSEMCLVGMQPLDIELGLELSPDVQEAMPRLIEAVLERLAKWGADLEAIKCA